MGQMPFMPFNQQRQSTEGKNETDRLFKFGNLVPQDTYEWWLETRVYV